ncbi:MAG: twin-arginine translocase TatA/TatE family subunit, partial [Peptococcaceae bacterium]
MFGYIANIGPASLVLILVIALIIFGPGKLPGVGKALGESVHGFKKGISGDSDD